MKTLIFNRDGYDNCPRNVDAATVAAVRRVQGGAAEGDARPFAIPRLVRALRGERTQALADTEGNAVAKRMRR
jgi:hypothetical protein